MAYEDYTPKEISSFMGLIDTYIRWDQYQKRDERKYVHYHPSEWGKCLRMQQYKHYVELGYIKSEFTPFDSKLLRLFDKGHNMHSRWIKYFDNIGNILMGRWRCKNILCSLFDSKGEMTSTSLEELKKVYKNKKSRIYGNKNPILKPDECVCGCREFNYEETTVEDKSLNIRGRADMILNCDNLDVNKFKDVAITFDTKFLPVKGMRVVGDFKTINSRSFTSQLEKKGPHKSYLIQLTIYTHILDCDYGLLMYECKDNSEMRWYMVPRNDTWWETIKYQAKKMIDIASSKQLPPPRPLKNDSYECSKCTFKNMCKKSSVWKKENLNEARRQFYKDLL